MSTTINLLLDWLAIARRLLAGFAIFAVGFHIANLLFRVITRSGTHRSHFFGRSVAIALTTLFAVIAFQEFRDASLMANKVFAHPEKAIVKVERKTPSQGWNNVSLGGGGYVTGIYIHPSQKDLVYIKTDIGGFYRWNPQNQSWIPISDRFSIQQSNYYGGEALALDPKNPDIVYIAAGKYLSSEPGTIFKSTDKGKTWTKLNLDLPMGGNEDKRWIGERLKVNPFNSNLIFFGSRQDGLWKSLDAGKTWANVTSFPGKPEKGIGITAILFDKQISGLVYAVAYGDGIYKSTDNGLTWSKIPDSPQSPRRMATGSNSTLYVTSGKGQGVTKYAKGVWSNITPKNSQATFNALSVNPANPNHILVSVGENPSTKIYRSLDEGTTWTEIQRSLNNTVPWWNGLMLKQPWISAIEFDSQVPGRVWLTDWYGIWRTEDYKANPIAWTNYQQGHEEIVSFTLVSPPKGAPLLSGVADVDGFYHNNGLDGFPSQEFGGNGPSFQDTYGIAYNEKDPLRVVRVGGNRWNNTYGGATSTDGGKTWQKFASFPENKMPMRVAVSATNPNLFVVTISGDRPLRTTDGGATWSEVSGLPKAPKGPWNWSQSLAADPVDGNTFYYYGDGKVFRSIDGGASFEIVDASPPNSNWHSLKTVPGVKGEVWLSLDWKGLYHSTNGQTFSKLNNVEQAYLFAIGKPSQGSKIPALYLYGKIANMSEGIFRSLDRGKTWTSISDRSQPIGNKPNAMEASKQQFGLVFIGTNGRGIYYRSSS